MTERSVRRVSIALSMGVAVPAARGASCPFSKLSGGATRAARVRGTMCLGVPSKQARRALVCLPWRAAQRSTR